MQSDVKLRGRQIEGEGIFKMQRGIEESERLDVLLTAVMAGTLFCVVESLGRYGGKL